MEERESNSCMVENPIFSAYQSRDYNMLLCILSKNMDIVVGRMKTALNSLTKLRIFDDPPLRKYFQGSILGL